MMRNTQQIAGLQFFLIRYVLTDIPPSPGYHTNGVYVPYNLFEKWLRFFASRKNQIS